MIGSGAYEEASELTETVLAKHPFTGRAYGMLGYMHTIADNDAIKNLKQAEEYLKIASDLGLDHELVYFKALLAKEQNDSSEAKSLLHKAMGMDMFGIGRAFYQYALWDLEE